MSFYKWFIRFKYFRLDFIFAFNWSGSEIIIQNGTIICVVIFDEILFRFFSAIASKEQFKQINAINSVLWTTFHISTRFLSLLASIFVRDVDQFQRIYEQMTVKSTMNWSIQIYIEQKWTLRHTSFEKANRSMIIAKH